MVVPGPTEARVLAAHQVVPELMAVQVRQVSLVHLEFQVVPELMAVQGPTEARVPVALQVVLALTAVQVRQVNLEQLANQVQRESQAQLVHQEFARRPSTSLQSTGISYLQLTIRIHLVQRYSAGKIYSLGRALCTFKIR